MNDFLMIFVTIMEEGPLLPITVIPRYLAPRYLANPASRHTEGQNGFPSMLITPLSRHPRPTPTPRSGCVLAYVKSIGYLAMTRRSIINEASVWRSMCNKSASIVANTVCQLSPGRTSLSPSH